MIKERLFYAMVVFAIVSFVSIAAGNVLLGISVLLYMIYVYITINLPHLHVKTATAQRQNCHTKNCTATIYNF